MANLAKGFYGTSTDDVANQINAFISIHTNYQIIICNYTTTPEPASYYSAGNYPGFKHAALIIFKTP